MLQVKGSALFNINLSVTRLNRGMAHHHQKIPIYLRAQTVSKIIFKKSYGFLNRTIVRACEADNMLLGYGLHKQVNYPITNSWPAITCQGHPTKTVYYFWCSNYFHIHKNSKIKQWQLCANLTFVYLTVSVSFTDVYTGLQGPVKNL